MDGQMDEWMVETLCSKRNEDLFCVHNILVVLSQLLNVSRYLDV